MIKLGDSRYSSAFAAIAGSSKAKAADGEIRSRVDAYQESNSSNAAYEAGVWKIGDRLVATNRPDTEDEWLVLDPNSMEALLEGIDYRLFEESANSKPLIKEIWRALLIAMLVFLITEALLCLQPKSEKKKT